MDSDSSCKDLISFGDVDNNNCLNEAEDILTDVGKETANVSVQSGDQKSRLLLTNAHRQWMQMKRERPVGESGDESDHSLESIDLSTHELEDETQELDRVSVSEQPDLTDCDTVTQTVTSNRKQSDVTVPSRKSSERTSEECNQIDASTSPLDQSNNNNNNEVGPKLSSLHKAFGISPNSVPRKLAFLSQSNGAHSKKDNNKLLPKTDKDAPSLPLNLTRTRHTSEDSNGRRNSVFDDLLFEIYDRWHYGFRDSFDSDTFTDLTESDAVISGKNGSHQAGTDVEKCRLNQAVLQAKDTKELKQMASDLLHCSCQMSSLLIRQLKRRERCLTTLHEKCDIMTAILHASSLKRREDSKIRFSIEPLPGDDAFVQWKDAMKAVARLSMGIPPEFRKKVWVALADNYLSSLCIDWEKTKKFTFNEKSNPDDNKLGMQIVKDLHRTGCSGFSGRDNEEDRAVLKRVLLAYARWNKHVGYCQGFNVLAALILDVMDRQEDSALKVMIYLIDRVLPESYFANNLRALSVDMAVFRDLLHSQMPQFSRHLDFLQTAASDQTTGANYEPPLTNVFTMQWFLTLFATCLPKSTALRVWDSILLEGSEILLRTAIAIWGTLQCRILNIQSADEFYTSMGVFSQEMLEGRTIDADTLMKTVYSMAPFPLPQLGELREKYTYNITPFTAMMNVGKRSHKIGAIPDEEDGIDDDEMIDNINCFAGFFPSQQTSPTKSKEHDTESGSDISKVSPGAYTAHPEAINIGLPVFSERVTLDIEMLRRQYKKLKERQKQAHVIQAAARHKQFNARPNQKVNLQASVAPIETPTAVNHLFVSRQMMESKNRTVTKAPTISSAFYKNGTSSLQTHPVKMKSRKERFSDPAAKYRHSRSPSIESSTSAYSIQSIQSASIEGLSSFGSGSETSEVTCEHTGGWSDITSEAGSVIEHSTDCTTSPKHLQIEEISIQDENRMKEEVRCGDENVISEKQSDACAEIAADAGDKINSDENEERRDKKCRSSVSKIDDKSAFADTAEKIEKPIENKSPCSNNKLKIERPNSCNSSSCGSYISKKSENESSVPTWLKETAEIQNSAENIVDGETAPKAFNPFPRQYANQRKTRHGIGLGLYSSENVTKISKDLETKPGDASEDRPPLIVRSYHNACLHRQYMVGVSRQSKHLRH